MKPTDEAVEAGAKALHEMTARGMSRPERWEDTYSAYRFNRKQEMRRALEAMIPFLEPTS